MKKKVLSAAYLSSFCLELSLVLKAGIPLAEGVSIIREGETDEATRDLLSGLYDRLETGQSFYQAAKETGAYPAYMLDMIDLGEKTGRIESVLYALSGYYDRKDNIAGTVRNAVLYPLVLLVMMLFVILLLITKVMPIFHDVFLQLGGSMSGFATWIMRLGEGISDSWLVLLGVLAGIVVAVWVLTRIPALRVRFREWMGKMTFSVKLGRTVASAQFASAMALTMAGGLDLEQSLEMAERVTDNAKMREKIAQCRTLCASGTTLGEAVSESGVLSPLNAQMLSIGIRTGNSDTVMQEIAERCEQAVIADTETALSRVEPTLVIIMSLLVGVVLLSVMLPLMQVMSAI